MGIGAQYWLIQQRENAAYTYSFEELDSFESGIEAALKDEFFV
jgi:hypothetical protein